MFRKVYIANKEYSMKPFRTQDELDLLEFLQFNKYDDDNEYEVICDSILSKCVKGYAPFIEKIEKILMLWQLRIITLGDDINVTYKCPKCGVAETHKISILNAISNASRKNKAIRHKIISANDFKGKDELQNIDNVNIAEYEDIIEHISEYFTIYDDSMILKCSYCNSESKINLMTFKNALTFLSDDSFKSLTSWIHALVYFGKHTRQDVLQMTPVQRMMELDYFKAQQEQERKDLENA